MGVGIDVGMDLAFNNANFDLATSIGNSLKDPWTYIGAIPVGSIGKLGKLARIAEGAEQGVRLYRVEGKINEWFMMDALGNVSLKAGDTSMLHVSFDAEHASYFLEKRVAQNMEGVHIKSFEVKSSFLGQLRADAVPQSQARLFPGRPQIVDVTTCRECYGITSDYLGALRDAIIPGTGRVVWPKTTKAMT